MVYVLVTFVPSRSLLPCLSVQESDLNGLSCPHPLLRLSKDEHQQEFRQSRERLFNPRAYSLQGVGGPPPSVEGSLQVSWEGQGTLPAVTNPRLLQETTGFLRPYTFA